MKLGKTNIEGDYGHRRTKQIQKTQKSKHLRNREHLNMTQKPKQRQNVFTVVMATDAQNKFRKRGNSNIHQTCENLNMTQKSEPEKAHIYDG